MKKFSIYSLALVVATTTSINHAQANEVVQIAPHETTIETPTSTTEIRDASPSSASKTSEPAVALPVIKQKQHKSGFFAFFGTVVAVITALPLM
jgi:hypothetical protein